MSANAKHGFNRLFLVVALGWGSFWSILYPLHRQSEGQEEALVEHDKENKNCDKLVVERPEWDMTKDCYQRSFENFQNTMTFYSYKNFWAYPVAFWKLFLPTIVVPPVLVYCLAALVVWVRNGFKPRTSHAP